MRPCLRYLKQAQYDKMPRKKEDQTARSEIRTEGFVMMIRKSSRNHGMRTMKKNHPRSFSDVSIDVSFDR